MRTLCALSVVFLLGCGAATIRSETLPEIPWNVYSAGNLRISAPPGWNQPFHRVNPQPERAYSTISLANQQQQEITVLHPHGNVEYAERVFLGNYMRAALVAAAAQQPELLEQLEIQSMTVTDPVALEGTEGAYMYLVTTVEQDGTVEENWILIMMLNPPDASSTILVSTTVPAAEGEQFPAEVLEIVRTLQYTPPE